MSATPRIRALTERLFPYIGQFLKEKNRATEVEVHSYLEEQKRETPDKFRDVEFRCRGFTAEGYPWSPQVELAITNLVATRRVAESGNKLELTSYGKQLISC